MELNGKPFLSREKVEYLGVSLGPSGVTSDRLNERVNVAMTKLIKLMCTIKGVAHQIPSVSSDV